PLKVLAMCQIRAKIYQNETNANIDYARECFYSNSILNNQLDEMEIENLKEAQDDKRNMLIENDIELEEEWHKIVQHWIELLDDD
ncbi:9702_t:CDS:1, partial [Dentiscutata erythropus]